MTTAKGARSVLVLNGPNLNLLGTREPEKYGSTTLSDVITECSSICSRSNATFTSFQCNSEGGLVDRIHAAQREGVEAIVINAGAYTHTSVAVRDALVGVSIPFVEVHVTNVYAREAFRHHSYLCDKATGVVAGLGVYGYYAALRYCLEEMSVTRRA